MNIGSALFGIAALAVVVAYLARPFRPTRTANADRTIEGWVAQVQSEKLGLAARRQHESVSEDREPAARSINYCHQCGQRVQTDDRFCSACGARLRRSEG